MRKIFLGTMFFPLDAVFGESRVCGFRSGFSVPGLENVSEFINRESAGGVFGKSKFGSSEWVSVSVWVASMDGATVTGAADTGCGAICLVDDSGRSAAANSLAF